MSKDYRNTDKCPILSEVALEKDKLEQKIREEHKMVRIMYNPIKDKHGAYFNDFAKIYNFKCAYCGASLDFTDIHLFEVDHFICESAFPKDTNGRTEAGKIRNLVFSCYSCNRGKGSLYIESDYQSLLNPDNNSIANVFSRDDEYYIIIRDVYYEDKIVHLFYEKLMFGNEARRLNFLLFEMNNLIIYLRRNSNKELADRLEQCMLRLLQKKNLTLI